MFRYIYVEEKFKFFVNYNKQSRNFHYNALKTLKIYGFPRFTNGPYQGCAS